MSREPLPGITEIRCDSHGCALYISVGSRPHGDYVTQYSAAAIAREAHWLVVHGAKRDLHYCPIHGRSLVAIVLRFAAGDGRNAPIGIHAAMRELGVPVLGDVGDAVWTAYYSVKTETPGSHRDELLAAALQVEQQA